MISGQECGLFREWFPLCSASRYPFVATSYVAVSCPRRKTERGRERRGPQAAQRKTEKLISQMHAADPETPALGNSPRPNVTLAPISWTKGKNCSALSFFSLFFLILSLATWLLPLSSIFPARLAGDQELFLFTPEQRGQCWPSFRHTEKLDWFQNQKINKWYALFRREREGHSQLESMWEKKGTLRFRFGMYF